MTGRRRGPGAWWSTDRHLTDFTINVPPLSKVSLWDLRSRSIKVRTSEDTNVKV